jgi:hypothetical protein
VIPRDELRRDQFVPQAGVDGKFGTEFEVILYIEEIHVLVVIDDPEIVELIRGACAGQEVREVCRLPCACVFGAGPILAEGANEVFGAVDGIGVINLRVDRKELPADLDAVTTPEDGVVDLRIDDKGVLELRVRVLRPPGGKPSDVSELRARITVGSVGRPGMPACVFKLVTPARYGVLPPCVRVKPMRASRMELWLKVWVRPPTTGLL